jgi:hypothetical protein
MKKGLTITWLMLILCGIGGMFYRMQWIYGLPTPVPTNYKNVSLGENIDLGLNRDTVRARPLFIHFFNPDCPCSRFNIPHFKSLVTRFGGEVDFAIVPVTSKAVSAEEILDRFKLDIPVLLNTTIATACGVYSTPQAAIIDVNGKLYYRGNYNRSRYCADKKTEYARNALEALLLASDTTLVFDQLALKAYGCRLPLCSNK